MKKVGIIHTTAATIESLNNLISRKISDLKVIHILDDSILPDMRDGNQVELVKKRWIGYARTLEELQVDVVFSACSTVGEYAEDADKLLNIPVIRIDEAMAEKAVKTGESICVLATLMSTLGPTSRLIEKKAIEAQKTVTVKTVLVEGAYNELLQGNKEAHDNKIRDAVFDAMSQSDSIVLAQASMAAALQGGETTDSKILTSPELGIEHLKKILGF